MAGNRPGKPSNRNAATSSSGERLQKALARAGLGSRRQIETWIRAGRIAVDGETAVLGQRVDSSSQIQVDGRSVSLRSDLPTRVFAYHKPEGELCTRHDPAGRPTVFDTLRALDGDRLICVGRLDINTSGLLLLTTDGELANRLMHPSSEVEREYRCRVRGSISESDLQRLRKGVKLEDGEARFIRVVAESRPRAGAANQWYRVTLGRGRYREVRRLWQAVGGEVSRLIRIRYGDIRLTRTLKPRHWQELDKPAVDRLLGGIGKPSS